MGRPDELASLHRLGIERYADAVTPKKLDRVTAPASKHVQIAGNRIALKCFLDLKDEPRHVAAHFGVADRQSDPHIGENRECRCTRTPMTRAKAIALTSRLTIDRKAIAEFYHGRLSREATVEAYRRIYA